MVRMSKYKVSKDVLDKTFSLFIEILIRSKNKTHIHQILFDILSPVERLMLAKRIAIMYLVRKGIDYYSICNTLKVSTTTIAKYVYLLERSVGIKTTLDSIMRDKDMKLLFKDLLGTLYKPGQYGINWKSANMLQNDLKKQKERGI